MKILLGLNTFWKLDWTKLLSQHACSCQVYDRVWDGVFFFLHWWTCAAHCIANTPVAFGTLNLIDVNRDQPPVIIWSPWFVPQSKLQQRRVCIRLPHLTFSITWLKMEHIILYFMRCQRLQVPLVILLHLHLIFWEWNGNSSILIFSTFFFWVILLIHPSPWPQCEPQHILYCSSTLHSLLSLLLLLFLPISMWTPVNVFLFVFSVRISVISLFIPPQVFLYIHLVIVFFVCFFFNLSWFDSPPPHSLSLFNSCLSCVISVDHLRMFETMPTLN